MFKIVDFNNESTIGTPAVNIVKVLCLQARENLFEALEAYNSAKYNGSEPSIAHVKARLISWFLQHQAYLKRTSKENEFTKLKNKIFNDEFDETEIYEVIYFFNEVLDRLKVTQLDTKKNYDNANWEQDNQVHGY